MWATFIPAEPLTVSPRVQQPRGVSVIARDFQTVALYKADGTFAGIRRPGSNKPIEVRSAAARLHKGQSKLQCQQCLSVITRHPLPHCHTHSP